MGGLQIGMQSSKPAITLVPTVVQIPVFRSFANGATGLLHVLAVGEATTRRKLIDFRKAETARLERIDGGREITNAGRVDDMTAAR
ncbi:MAG: hypothetical protein RL597_56 [Pseudomonadota bacterium]